MEYVVEDFVNDKHRSFGEPSLEEVLTYPTGSNPPPPFIQPSYSDWFSLYITELIL